MVSNRKKMNPTGQIKTPTGATGTAMGIELAWRFLEVVEIG
jgi:hypothetical protein